MFPQTQVENILNEVKKHIDCYSGFKFDNGKIKFTVFHETSFSHYKPETIDFSYSEIMKCYKVPHVQFLELWKSKGGTAFNLTIWEVSNDELSKRNRQIFARNKVCYS